MELSLANGKTGCFRPFQDTDFARIQILNRTEGWTNLANDDKTTFNAWNNSNVRFVVCAEDDVVGYIRGLTDKHVTLYICELLIERGFRGMGIGSELLHYVHRIYPNTRMELLASQSSFRYYEQNRFRNFPGFRKTSLEY